MWREGGIWSLVGSKSSQPCPGARQGMTVKEYSPNRKLLVVFGVFLAAYFIPFEAQRVMGATSEAFLMLGEYARLHVLLCLVPAMFIAGAITVFLNQQAVMRYLGPKASKPPSSKFYK
jgi:hypothetical protein